ncbi:MAG TPA: hypothetical protein VGQ59_08030 [Cyclobacteriaceae bacterium]|jgi:hypothetical protein|nr:hypothetical protein [Cyclobacteriaceae bacterium]
MLTYLLGLSQDWNITRFYDGEYKNGAMRIVFDRTASGQKNVSLIYFLIPKNQAR